MTRPIPVAAQPTCASLLRSVLVLGLAGTALLPAQIHWSEVPTLTTRRRAGMAFDVGRGRMVLTGGNLSRGTAQTQTLNDTWEFETDGWTRRLPVISPSLAELSRAMVYDSARSRVVLFNFSASSNGETWRWDGRIWVRLSTAAVPPARFHYAAAYDEARGRMVLFGGSTASGGQQDVWEYDGTNWVGIAAPGPVVRDDPAMAWDGASRRVLMHGGRTVGTPSTALSDTWQWDGSAWTRMSPTTVPSGRSAHAMAWSPVRNRVVMFGGGDGVPGTVNNETWEWSGTDWARIVTRTLPPARTNHAMAFDARRGVVVLAVGESATGLFADTWSFDGTDWAVLAPEGAPPARSEHGAAFDAARGQLVIFGGRNSNLLQLGDTWTWSDFHWAQSTPAASPTPRHDHAMVYDPLRQQVVLFGGTVGATPQNDTWLWNGATWARVNPANQPSARANHAMAWDSARSRVVLFGGATPTAQADTWEWDGSNWAQVNTLAAPAARSEHALGFDPVTQRVLLCGGRSATNLYLQDTWLYDGTTWVPQMTGNTPTTRSNTAMAVDGRRNRLSLFGGGAGTTTRGDTLEWSGSSWVNQVVFPAPLGRQSHTLTYDSKQRHIVQFGGENTLGRRAETWVLSSAEAGRITSIFNTGCAGFGSPTPATIESFSRPHVGNRSFAFDLYTAPLASAPSPVVFLLSATQGSTGLPGCPLAVDPATTFLSAARLQTATFAKLHCPLPNNLSLLGSSFVVQALHLAPPTQWNGLAASTGYTVRIGDF